MKTEKSFLILLTGYGIMSLVLGIAGWVLTARSVISEDIEDTVYWITKGIAASVAGITLLVAKRRHPDETTLPTRYRVVVGLCMMIFPFGALFRFVSMFQK